MKNKTAVVSYSWYLSHTLLEFQTCVLLTLYSSASFRQLLFSFSCFVTYSFFGHV